ncbi:alpha/beta hydrolase [Egibacter rhizosphaerae]|uniref:Alpha/beta hydrolase n=1 Tax=Egibacter rhizosphaerae TaxID=1670831 RepID=A0A411YDU1_9ACTN|nr:alpha/beta hydrolase [Egibacter rhizosphaerae]QBI19409.1 alpha/beta hydrolase [Egibacter rhizosphaerae]
MRTEELEFVGSAGDRLAGVLHVPEDAVEGPPRGSIVLAHCFTCSKDLHTMTRLARGLAEAGYAVLRFDFTGLGESEGEFGETTVSTNVGDLVRAAAALLERGYGPCGLVGHSLGGAAALLASERLKTVRSVAVIGAPSTPEHVRHLLSDREDAIRRKGEAVVEIAGRPFPIAEEFLDDLEAHRQRDHVRHLGRPLLVLHAVDDEVVGVDEGEANFAAARQPKSFVPLLETDHLLSSHASAEQALDSVRAWFERTL